MPAPILAAVIGFCPLCRSRIKPEQLSGNPHCRYAAQGVLLASLPVLPMSLVPRWRYMTDEAKALTKRTAVSALVVLLVLVVFRALVPWVVLAVVVWWIWTAVRK